MLQPDKSDPPRQPATRNSNNLRDRHKQAMRQQYYTNNERFGQTQATTSKTTTETSLALLSEPASSPLLQHGNSSNLDQANSTEPFGHEQGSTLLLSARDCFQHGVSPYHAYTCGTSPTMMASGNVIIGEHQLNASSSNSVDLLDSSNDERLSFLDAPEDKYFSKIPGAQVWFIKDWHDIRIRVALVVPIVLLGILGNATIIYSMCRFKPFRSKPTNIFILNMAIADLITTIVCPNAALFTYIYQFYMLGAFVCRTEGFIKVTCLLVSAYSLIVLSFDWFLSVVKPCRTRIGIRQSWFTLISIWLVSIMMAAPLLFLRQLRQRHWKDLTESWCAETLGFNKYYWVTITFFLIYLPTFITTIVLVIILIKMDKFEAKLKRTNCLKGARASANATEMRRSTVSSVGSIMRNSSFSIALDSHQNPSVNTIAFSNATNPTSRTDSLNGNFSGVSSSSVHNNRSLSISMKYRRRIVKILFFYLLTSIVCWTPFQFTVIWRFFRSNLVLPDWYLEMAFFTQLCASLSAAMNPIIFGFLSQPFRQIVLRSWVCRLCNKLWPSRRKPPKVLIKDGHPRQKPAGGAGGQAGEHQMGNWPQVALVNQQQPTTTAMRPAGHSNRSYQASGSPRGARSTRDTDLDPKLTIEFVGHHQQQAVRWHAAGKPQRARVQRPKSASIAARTSDHHHHLFGPAIQSQVSSERTARQF